LNGRTASGLACGTHAGAGSLRVVRKEASYWWRTNVLAGALLHRLMLLFIVVPVLLAFWGYFVWSLAVFCSMIPYGLLMERLAERAVRNFIRVHPESAGEFEESGILRR